MTTGTTLTTYTALLMTCLHNFRKELLQEQAFLESFDGPRGLF